MPDFEFEPLNGVVRLQRTIPLTRRGILVGALIPSHEMQLIGTIANLSSAVRMTTSEFAASYDELIETIDTGSVVITDNGDPIAALISPKHFFILTNINRQVRVQERTIDRDDLLNDDYKPRGRKKPESNPGPTKM